MIRKVWDFIFALITASSKYNRFLERSENNMKAKTKVNILGFLQYYFGQWLSLFQKLPFLIFHINSVAVLRCIIASLFFMFVRHLSKNYNSKNKIFLNFYFWIIWLFSISCFF